MKHALDLTTAWTTFPALSTDRLQLRALTLADAPAHFAIYSDPQIAEAHSSLPYQNLAESEQLIRWYADAFKKLEAIRWAIVLQEETAVIGTVGFHALSKRHFRAEIGYEILPAYWRKGFASEAINAVLAFGFNEMSLHRIEANVDPVNKVSASFLAKMGFVEEGYLRERFYDNGRFVDDWYFSILRHEFNQKE